jgi:hypothetical protein
LILALELLFALLVAADTWLTYRIIDSGKGVEIGPVAKYYIDNKAVAIALTVIVVAALISWLRLVGVWWIVVPAYIAVYLRLGWLCYKHIRILHA